MTDTLEIRPLAHPVDAVMTIPGSKSYTNRALTMAALARGDSELRGALFSDDTRYMTEALGRLGVQVTSRPQEGCIEVAGCDGIIPASQADLFVGESGTCARFLVGLTALGHGTYTIDGHRRMRERPIQDLLDGLEPLGVRATTRYANGCPPVIVEADGIAGGRTRMPGGTSSQYFTSILLAAPYAKQDIEIEVLGDLISKPYIDMTLSGLRSFGAEFSREGYGRFRVRAGKGYGGRAYEVEPDASNASYFLAVAALTAGRVRVRYLNLASAQGDVHFVDVLERMGCRVESGPDYIEVQGPRRLQGMDVDLNAMPDTAQTLAAIAPFAEGPTTIRNVASMRIKETDRIRAVVTELQKLGVRAEELADGLVIFPASSILPGEIDTYNDHRMAMSFALIGLRARGIVIRDPGCVSKTFPGYFSKLEELRR